MADRRTILLLAGLPGQDFSAIAEACAAEGAAFVALSREAVDQEDKSFQARLSRINRRILDLSGYGWADVRMLRQDASFQNIDSRFAQWASMRMQDLIAKAWEAAPADSGKPLVIAGDTLAPTIGIWAQAFTALDVDVRPVLLALTADEAMARFTEAFPGKIGIPGGPQLWLKHTLLALSQMAEQDAGQLTHWTDDQASRDGMAGLLKGETPVAFKAPDRSGLARNPDAFDLVSATEELLAQWPGVAGAERKARSGALLDSLRTMAALYGDMADIPEKLAAFRVPLTPAPTVKGRAVILHYHSFKNAGTSVDAMLKDNFGQLCDSREFEREEDMRPLARDWILSKPQKRAFSSHTLEGPVPDIPGVDILPVIFLRHPIDRARSAYLFERRQAADTKGAELAKTHDFASYIDIKMQEEYGWAVVNFNCVRLSMFSGAPGEEPSLERAMETLDRLPFVGLVEQFEASIRRLETLMRAYYPDVVLGSVLKNATRAPELSLEDRLQEIRAELGDARYDRLEAANKNDLALFERVNAFYSQNT
ncbi:hypothetical protein [Kordiimonas marina]|uniref:hypothetical protein n=1 Tax=Kordiimonas marina TaxID=2872312 RepID=UPI001FF11F1F|nr:hypothetical protein [Kordiimonas marina]MCJ9429758.1 hypothetical protein [Kordiimonas marina]